MSDDDDNVTKLPVKFKNPAPEGRSLVLAFEVGKNGGCTHYNAHYVVDDKLAEVECGTCGAKLNPIWVLMRLATEDRRYVEARARYQEEMARLKERERTKCEHCGHMTRISHR